MRKVILPFVFTFLLIGATFFIVRYARGQGPEGFETLQSENQGDARREIYAPSGISLPEQPSIGFIDSPTVGCYQPDPGTDSCNINWYSMWVDASPNYIISMTVTVNGLGLVANYSGFFQTSMQVPYDMTAPGFKVACGAPGAGGNPNLGNAYSWAIRAKDSNNLSSANYGTIYCPPYVP